MFLLTLSSFHPSRKRLFGASNTCLGILILLDAPSLLYGIGRELYSNQYTQELLYHNKKAGISLFVLTFHSSVSTVLPETLGKSNIVGVEDNGILLHCAKMYIDWFCNENGVNTGVKPQILSGLEYQRAIHNEVLTNLSAMYCSSALALSWSS